jgi:hypothetical protein
VELWGRGFFSSSQFQRENIFSVCLSPALPLQFELTDLGGDGLVGSFIDSVIYGKWQLTYNGGGSTVPTETATNQI